MSVVNGSTDFLRLRRIAVSGTLDFLGFLSFGTDGTRVRLALKQA
jgi:hypothetical protein